MICILIHYILIVGKECLYLSDVFAIVPGPNNPPSRSHGPRRLSSSSIDSCCEFTIHALKSMPNSPGALMRVTFKSTKNTSVSDACEVWTQQIKHQLQSKNIVLCTYTYIGLLYNIYMYV